MSSLFDQTSINSMRLKNRFVRSATNERMATPSGTATPELIALHAELAQGGVALSINGHTAVSPEGKAGPLQHTLYPGTEPVNLKEMAEAVHKHGSALCMQIAHAGVFARPEDPGLSPVGPSSPPAPDAFPACLPMSTADIDRVVECFANAAATARKCDFDAVQIHAAHTYLLSQFLSPYFNKRQDDYGGSLENRARFLLRVVKAARETVGANFPLLVKMNSEDFLDSGLIVEEALQVALMLEKAGVDAIELSGGAVFPKAKFMAVRPGPVVKKEQEAFYRRAAEHIAPKLSIPLILVGGIRSLDVAEELLAAGTADYISLSRPLVCEPGLIKRWEQGDRKKARCVTDNLCLTSRDQPLNCVTFAAERKKQAKSA